MCRGRAGRTPSLTERPEAEALRDMTLLVDDIFLGSSWRLPSSDALVDLVEAVRVEAV